jgi:hypothetical protein
MAEEKSKLVRFAKAHSGTFFKTFDAGSALWRAESLLDDAVSLNDLKERCAKADVDFGGAKALGAMRGG